MILSGLGDLNGSFLNRMNIPFDVSSFVVGIYVLLG
jgi:hypothetical protein